MTPQEYFEAHSLDPTFVKEKFGITWSDDTITIPVYGEDRKLLFCRYRHLTGDAKFSSDKGSHPALFAIQKIKSVEEVVLCEGEPDCMRLWQQGIPAVTGTSGVKTFSKSLVKPLTGKIVNILLDSDEAGKTSVEKYVEVLSGVAKEIYVMNLPAEYKDISDFFTAGKSLEDFYKIPKLDFETWEEQNEPPEWALETATELMSRPLPPEEWLVDRVIPCDGFTFIAGAEATGKSFYTLTLAYSVATGEPWLGKFEVKKKAKVLFIDKENSARRRQKRFAGLGMRPTDDIMWIKQPQYFQLDDEKEEDGLSRFAKSVSKKVKKFNIGLIVIDSFADVMVGNENAAADVQGFFDAMRQLFPGLSILVLHHENKPSQGVARTASQRMRGSSNIAAQIVSGFRVFPIPKTQNEFVLEQFKAGDAEKLKPFKIELVSKVNPYNAQQTIISEVKHNGEYYDEEGKAELGEDLVLAFMEETPTATRAELLDHLSANGIGKRTGDQVIRDMADAGQLEKVKNGRAVSYMLK